jgi:hypothetical protein
MGFRNRMLNHETGIALPIVLAVLAVVTTLALVAATASIRANHQSFRERNQTRALQAAAAGIHTANNQNTLLQPAAGSCVVKSGSSLDVRDDAPIVHDTGGDWCPVQPAEDLGDNASYTVQSTVGTPYTANGQHLIQREIVSTGTVNGITRRVDVITNAATAAPLFPTGFAAVSLDPISWGNKMRANGNVGSNGNISLFNEAVICGDTTTLIPSTTSTANTASVCGSRNTTSDEFVLDPVDQGTSPDASNGRLAYLLNTNNPKPGPTDDGCTSCSGVSWNNSTRVLALSGSATLTLGGSSYRFCKITLRNQAQLKVAVSARVKIYIDKPENCQTAGSNAGSVILSNSSALLNLNSTPIAMQIYLVGSSAIPTTLEFGNAFASDILVSIYAPNSSVFLHNTVHLSGALAAKSIPVDNDASITYDSRVGGIVGGGIPVYRSTRSWIECTAKPTGTAVNSGCWNYG